MCTASRCRLMDLVSPQHTGQPHFVVSHSWQSSFGELVTQLARHLHIDLDRCALKSPGTVVVWSTSHQAAGARRLAQNPCVNVSSPYSDTQSHQAAGAMRLAENACVRVSSPYSDEQPQISHVSQGAVYLERLGQADTHWMMMNLCRTLCCHHHPWVVCASLSSDTVKSLAW